MTASYECPKCHRVSHNPNDVRYGYCGSCHEFTEEGHDQFVADIEAGWSLEDET